MKKFKVGETYSARSICNYDTVWNFTIVKRTAKSIWAEIDGKVQRRAVRVWNDKESFSPFGSYSMAPVVNA
jgi:hypothetical protein